MINYSDILSTLTTLCNMYDDSSDMDSPVFCSKLSLLEFSGWVELAFDEILKEYVNSRITEPIIRDQALKIIDNTYGFDYKKNIVPMMISIIGTVNYQVFLSDITPLEKEHFKNILSDFTVKRNRAAHTNIKGSAVTYDSPSVVKSNYQKLKPVIMKLEAFVSGL